LNPPAPGTGEPVVHTHERDERPIALDRAIVLAGLWSMSGLILIGAGIALRWH